MSKHDQSWRTFRMNRGLRWEKNYPSLQDVPNGKTALIIALCVFLVIALVVAVQYQNDAVKAVGLAEKRANQLGECIQGKARFVTEDDTAIVCRSAQEFPI